MNDREDGQEWEAGTRLRFHYGIRQELLEELAADYRDAQQFREFMGWLTDVQVVHWTLTEETANDPRKAVEALLQIYLNEINDPAISEVARKAADSDVLRERVRVLEETLRDIVRLHDLHGDWARVDTMADIARALLSPAVATDGGEGA